MRRMRSAWLAVLLAGTLAGQARAAEEGERGPDIDWRRAAWYLPNRLLDLLDVFKLNVAGGVGTGVDLRLTRLIEAGFSEYSVLRVGVNGRRAPVYGEKLSEASLTLFGVTSGVASRDPYEVGVTLHFLIVGAEGAINLRAALDFLGGLLLFDLEDDDLGKRE